MQFTDLLINSISMEEKPTHECKNCSTAIEGQYCHFCGQRYHAHKESFGELAYEFISDFLHFDSRFFKTVLPLIFQPGKLTKSYNEGKQRSQFHPIRLYLFSSFVYFFLFFYFNNQETRFDNDYENTQTAIASDSVIRNINKDSIQLANFDTLKHIPLDKGTFNLSNPTFEKKPFAAIKDSSTKISLSVTPYINSLLQRKVTPKQYLEQQKLLSKQKKAGFWERILTLRLLKINLKGEEGKKEFLVKLTETFLHNIPKMLFFLLPVFALILKSLYIRKKQFFYVDHAVLSLHYFSLIFLLLILSNFILDKSFNTGNFTLLAFFWLITYLLVAMKRIYRQGWVKTIFKFFALGFLFMISVILAFIGNMVWTAFMI